MMEEERLDRYLAFINETELLKNVLRTAWGSAGRQESTAEHSWRLALFASSSETGEMVLSLQDPIQAGRL